LDFWKILLEFSSQREFFVIPASRTTFSCQTASDGSKTANFTSYGGS
jgi:hypothetical protein